MSLLGCDLKGAHLLCRLEILHKSFLKEIKEHNLVRQEKFTLQTEDCECKIEHRLSLSQTLLQTDSSSVLLCAHTKL